jgi:Poxvirus D5 protein-like
VTDDIKKLIEIASKPLKEPIKKVDSTSTVYQFILEAKVKSHTTISIPASLIYLRYVGWCKTNNVKAKNLQRFAIDFAKKFQKTLKKNKTHYYVSPEGFDLSAAALQDAELYTQEAKHGKKKAKKERKTKSIEGDIQSKD